MNKDNSILKLESICKYFSGEAGLKVNVLEDVNFEIPDSGNGTITSILAPFGSGKSTLLKIISGVIKQSSGKIYFSGSVKQETIPLIPEKPSSFPWLNVVQNIQLGLSQSGNRKFNLSELVSLVGLSGYENHFPNNKSLGFRFRISLARALAINPLFILIDDPFKQINMESREEIYELLVDVSTIAKQNFILATTNLVEAIQLSNKIFLMSKNPGRIIKQIDIDRNDSGALKNIKSEKFTLLKSQIEKDFDSVHSPTTINYSV